MAAALAALALSGCAGGSSGPAYPPGYWDYGFRYSIYEHHYDGDITINRPDRPRPPPGVAPGRPTTLPARTTPRSYGGGRMGGGRGGRR